MIIKDEGNMEEVIAELKKLEGAYVDIGIIGESGKYESITTLDLATIHEFGYGNVPERSFIRATFDNYNRELERLVDRNIDKVLDLTMSASELMDLIGKWGRDKTVEYLTKLNSPPLKPQTIKVKGSSNVLIDTGQLRGSITYKVVM